MKKFDFIKRSPDEDEETSSGGDDGHTGDPSPEEGSAQPSYSQDD